MEVKQSNSLTLARYDFSRTEKNVIYRIIQRVRSEYVEGSMFPDKWSNMIIHLSSNDFSKIADEDHTERARQALRNLRHKDIEIKDAAGNWLNVGFINYAKYRAKDKTYEVEVSKEIMPYLVELVKNFTLYGVTVAMSLKSQYSQKFYELACHWRDTGWFEYDIPELIKLFHLPPSYERKSHIKDRVLDVAKKELKTFYDQGLCDLWLEYTEKGIGEKTKFHFLVHKKEKDNSLKAPQEFNYHVQLAYYIDKRCREVFRRDPKFCERIKLYLDCHPDKIQSVYDKLMKMEKDYKGTDLAKLLRWVLREDFEIK